MHEREKWKWSRSANYDCGWLHNSENKWDLIFSCCKLFLLNCWVWWYFIVVAISYLGRASQVVLAVKNPPANAGDIRNAGLTLGWGRSPGGEHGNPFQCSCLENPMDREAWQATVHRVSKSWIQLKQLRMHTPQGEYEPELWSPVEERRKQNSDVEKLTELQYNSNWYEPLFSISILSELLNFHLI